MMFAMIRRGLAALLIGTALVGLSSMALPQEPETAPPPDVVVIARKLKTVKIDYSAFGSHIKTCDIRVSSGTPVLDRAFCALVSGCLADGQTGRDRAMRCVNERIARLEDASASAAPELPAKWMGPAASRSAIYPNEVVVTGQRDTVRPGSWVFTQIVTRRRNRGDLPDDGIPMTRQWRRCIPPSSIERLLAVAIEPPPLVISTFSVSAECYRWHVKTRQGALSGQMRCSMQHSSHRASVAGTFTADTLELTQDRAAFGARGYRIDTHTEIGGVREGGCHTG